MSKTNIEANEVTINGIVYVPKDQTKLARKEEGLQYVICRTYSAGVFAGFLAERKGQEVKLFNARRLWSWAGAASLSQMAMNGTSDPNNCKFPVPVEEVTLLQAIEIIPCTEEAKKSIEGVPIWKK